MASGIPDQRSRSRRDAVGSGRRGRPRDPVPLGAGRCGDAGAAGPAASAAMHRLVAGGQTDIKVKGIWTWLYRAVDSRGQTIDVVLPARRDVAAAKRFFRTALGQPHSVNPRTITAGKNPADPRATAEMQRTGDLCRVSRLRPGKYLDNIVEQDHRRITRLLRPGLGFGDVPTARPTPAGDEAMAMIRKGQVHTIDRHDMPAQTAVGAHIVNVAA